MPEELHLFPVEILPVEARQVHVPVPEAALKRHVVNGEDRSDAIESRLTTQLGGDECRDEARLPVVGMNHVGLQIEMPHHFHGRSTEEDEPLAVVAIVLLVLDIDPLAVEVERLVDQINCDVRSRKLSLQHAGIHVLVSHRNSHRKRHRSDRRCIRLFGELLRIVRQDQRDLVPRLCESLRQRGGHVTQATCFGEWHRFGTDNDDPHV